MVLECVCRDIYLKLYWCLRLEEVSSQTNGTDQLTSGGSVMVILPVVYALQPITCCRRVGIALHSLVKARNGHKDTSQEMMYTVVPRTDRWMGWSALLESCCVVLCNSTLD